MPAIDELMRLASDPQHSQNPQNPENPQKGQPA
jgi:hypothetical protein